MAYTGKSDVAFKPDDIKNEYTCYPFDFDPKTGEVTDTTYFFHTKIDQKPANDQQNSKYGEVVRYKAQ